MAIWRRPLFLTLPSGPSADAAAPYAEPEEEGAGGTEVPMAARRASPNPRLSSSLETRADEALEPRADPGRLRPQPGVLLSLRFSDMARPPSDVVV